MQMQPVKVNGIPIPEADILNEIDHHKEASDPWDMAISTLILRRLLLEEALRLELSAQSEEDLFTLLLQHEVTLPTLNEEECLRHYEQNINYFKVGTAADTDHILFQTTARLDQDALHKKAQQVLDKVLAEPARFGEFARKYSNCPSSEDGGFLGTLQKGQTVPEFEEVIFRAKVGQIHPALVETRFGFHIIRVQQRVEGELLAYEVVADRIREGLKEVNQNTAWRQYIQHLIKEAHIEGFDYESYLDENVFLS
ncbi:peptidylprolyl isomerase [Paenalcaligenes faecalis]|uniref:peptidylprolyl isomerase n=1 Tax=Paenalcaligenes faecalis TaxID=2980099 RepID=UPI0022B99685|nr:peptidylprolyl isomerase [Paenalcaligenes faecalis]